MERAVVRRPRRRELRGKSPSCCTACRTRGLLCDGKRPSCELCIRAGQICQDYRRSTSPPSSKRLSTLPLRGRFVSITTAPSSSADLFTTAQEHRSFIFFRQYTVPQVSSSFSDEFWNRLVLQATHQEPSIRHAAIALGSLHEQLTSHDGSLSLIQRERKAEEENFALSQYVKALGSLLKPVRGKGKQAADVALMTCVLFVCFETLRGHHSSALKHVDAGIKIISELSSSPTSTSNLTISPTPYAPLSTLRRIFIRLETQAGTVTFGQKRQLVSSAYDFEPNSYEEDIPAAFSSVEEARNALEYIRTIGAQAPRTFHDLFEVRDIYSISQARERHAIQLRRRATIATGIEAAKAELAIELIRSSATLRLRQWTSAFDGFVTAQTPAVLQDPTVKETILLCRLHRLLMDLSYKVDYWRAVHDEMVWDELVPEYAEIIRLAEEFTACSTLKSSSSSSSKAEMRAGNGELVFTLDPGLNVPLYFVAGKCRDSKLRRKAIKLLRAIERQEGVSNSVMTAKVAERLVNIEEEGLLDREGEKGGAEWVVRERRVSGVDTRFEGEERRAWVGFFRGGVEGGVIEEMIEW